MLGVSMAKGLHHQGSYQRASERVRAAAYANPNTLCRRCGEPLQPSVKGKDRWTAGHVIDGQIGGALSPEHHGCNSSAGATMGNKRRGNAPPTRWF